MIYSNNFFKVCKTKLVFYFIILKSQIIPLILSVKLKAVLNWQKLHHFQSIFVY